VGPSKVHQQGCRVGRGGSRLPSDTQRFNPLRSCLEDGVASAASPQVKGQGEVSGRGPPYDDHQGNAAQDAVRVGSDV